MRRTGIETLGIMISEELKGKHSPFTEAPYFMQLSEEGRRLGIRVIVFDPKFIDWKSRTVPGWSVLPDRRWIRGTEPLPKLVYDRIYYLDSAHYLRYKPFVQKVADDPGIRLLGRALGGKMQTHEILSTHPEIKPFLPPTARYQTPKDVLERLDKFGSVLIKPNGGSHGRGVVAINRTGDKWWVRGRSKANHSFETWFFRLDDFLRWIRDFIGNTRYVIQPFLDLTTADGRPFDVRILVQKNEQFAWETTGMAVRIGNPRTITSNLHGGGQAVKFEEFLAGNYDESLANTIRKNIRFLSRTVPSHIEKNHGPLLELGLDVGIDKKGNVWILEVNSKPGRTVFIRTGELDIRKRAVRLPILYAGALLASSGGSL
ncbi:YheC/YheD family protein [Staphylospora marina]|uniref:YheC/YheD family endospore coat-associated protein n=1 Tax=Staphylospora marina TaxID=2490858 RepID=UPI000F5BE756|nr:YheC/YheD family protein [Staphylospora marina]